jgi:hypothetical protein
MSRRLILLAAGVLIVSLLLVVWLGRVLYIGPFAPTPWHDAAGRTASFRHFDARDVPFQRRGPSHCGWNDEVFIAYEDGQYVQDRSGHLMAQAKAQGQPITYDARAELPNDARSTGWARDGDELWVSPAEFAYGHYRNIYLVAEDHVERWPDFGLGCA